MEPLADWPGSAAADDTSSALLARDGDSITAFTQDGYAGVIYARERMPDGTWTPEQEVPCVSATISPEYCELHGATLGAAGELVALMHLYARRRSALAISIRPAGQTLWSKPQIISDGYLVASDYTPTISGSRRGAILVTFGDFHLTKPMTLIGAHLKPGQTWNAATYHRLPGTEWPKVSGLSNRGQAVVIYANDTSISAPVLVARLVPGRGWTRPTRLGTGWTENYAVAIAPSGRAVATWLETTGDLTQQTLTRQSQRARVMTPRGRWGRTAVLARGERGTSGNAVAWAHDDVGIAWGPWIGSAVRVATKPAGQPWHKSTVAGGGNAGALRSIDMNDAGDLLLVWENWREDDGYALALALRPHGENWSAPRRVNADLQQWAVGSALAHDDASALVAYGDDTLLQVVARRVHVDPAPTSN